MRQCFNPAYWWRRRQRKIDRELLFPIIRKQAEGVHKEREAIEWHILKDPAWRYPSEFSAEDRMFTKDRLGVCLYCETVHDGPCAN